MGSLLQVGNNCKNIESNNGEMTHFAISHTIGLKCSHSMHIIWKCCEGVATIWGS